MKLNYNDPETQSKDLTTENIEQLKKLFPNIVEEGKVNFDVLRQLLGEEVVREQEYYRFTWPGKHQARQEALKSSTGTLRPVKEESVDWDSTENLYIEGDNLEVLKLLQKSYFNKVKMIYIDPPYNTGKDFVYKDNYKDNLAEYNEKFNRTDAEGNVLSSETNNEGNARYHSNWLNMMYPRLQLARTLLKDDGVIFISIDDNEAHNLRQICDEIFGDENFIGVLSVENNPKGRKNSAFISVSSEYCIIYAKIKDQAGFIENIPKNAKDMTKDENGIFVHNSGKRVLVGENNFNSYVDKRESDKNYSVYYCQVENNILVKNEGFDVIDNELIEKGYVRYFSHRNNRLVENTYTKQRLLELAEQHALEFSDDKIYEKNFNDTIRIKSLLVNRKYEAIVKGVEKTYSMELTTTGAGTYLKNLFDTSQLIFTAPKNTGYLRILISLFENKDFIMLDFFSGSSSSADAVMRLNAEDGGSRKYIMVQLPEPTDEKSEAYKAGYKTISDIGKERIRRAANQIKEELKDQPDVLEKLDLGFKVFKLDSSNIHTWDTAPEELENNLFREEVIKDDRTAEDVLYEVLLKYGLDLTYPIEEVTLDDKKVYSVGAGQLIFCLDDGVTRDTAQAIIDWAKEDEIIDPKVVFKDAGFTNDVEKTNLIQLFKTHGVMDVKSI